MIAQSDMMDQIMERVTEQVVDGIKGSITEIVEKELSSSLTRALVESEFYRKLSGDMRSGLQTIYLEIANATKPAETSQSTPIDQQSADKLFNEASRQLDEILQTTEKATEEIMDVVENHMELQSKATELLGGLRKTRKSNPAIHELININDDLGDNLMKIMTSLSFQDLTGQRIKKIITALKKIETTVFDMYMSSGLIIKAHDEAPDKNIEELEKETKQKVSELKGPVMDTDQGSVDDLLGQLGLD